MTFTVGTITRCAGQEHYNVPITIGAQTRTIRVTRGEMQLDFSGEDELRELVLNRLRSAAKEAGAATFAQIKTALETHSYQL